MLRALRSRKGWTLKEMGKRTDLSLSTLSKVENDRLTLTYDKLQRISQRLSKSSAMVLMILRVRRLGRNFLTPHRLNRQKGF